MTQTVLLVHVNIWPTPYLASPVGWWQLLNQGDRRQVIQFSRFEITWECVVVKYETLLTLSGRVEYVRKQHISFSVYQGGQHNTTSYLYKSGHNPVIAAVIRISYVNQMVRYITVVARCLVFVLKCWRRQITRHTRHAAEPTTARPPAGGYIDKPQWKPPD